MPITVDDCHKATKDVSCDQMIVNPATGLVRIDGLPLCTLSVSNGYLYICFRDQVKARAEMRQAGFLRIPLTMFIAKLQELADEVT